MDTHVSQETAAAAFLLVLCHGFGADHRQMQGVSQALRGPFPAAAAFAPDAPERCRHRFMPVRGRQWFSLQPPREAQMPACAAAAAWLNGRADAELAARGLPPDAVVFCGFSQGAMVALLAGLTRRVAPRGIVAIAGDLLAPEEGFVPLCRPPVLLVHGEEDRVVPASRSEAAAMRLRAARIEVRLEVLPVLGHMIVADAVPAAAAFIARVCR